MHGNMTTCFRLRPNVRSWPAFCAWIPHSQKAETQRQSGVLAFTQASKAVTPTKLIQIDLVRWHDWRNPLVHRAGWSRVSNSVSRGFLVTSENLPRFTRTALDVDGPGVEAFGMISESCPALIVAGCEIT